MWDIWWSLSGRSYESFFLFSFSESYLCRIWASYNFFSLAKQLFDKTVVLGKPILFWNMGITQGTVFCKTKMGGKKRNPQNEVITHWSRYCNCVASPPGNQIILMLSSSSLMNIQLFIKVEQFQQERLRIPYSPVVRAIIRKVEYHTSCSYSESRDICTTCLWYPEWVNLWSIEYKGIISSSSVKIST